jgi:hypothetical protein
VISDETTIEQYLAIRKKAALEIDPRTAEIEWWYAQTVDPYGVRSEIPDECWQVGREYFARSPGSEVWVSFGDLPAATRDALWEKHKTKLAFAADLNGPADDFDPAVWSAEEQVLHRAHEEEAHRRDAEFWNYAKGTDDNNIISKTSKGFLYSEIDPATMKVTHQWMKY